MMAKQGRGGAALAVAALASFFAGTVGTILLAVTGPALAGLALSFRSPEYFSIMIFALVMSSALIEGSMAKGILMALFGMLVGILGTDLNSGVNRFTFGVTELSDGIEFSIAAVGLFAFSEVMLQLEDKEQAVGPVEKITRYMPTKEEFRASIGATIRGTALGSFLGFLPGVGAVISSFSAYALEKRVSKTPERFGSGAVEGVAAPEAANNAAAQCSFIPTLTLGLPGSATMALMLGALMIQNITPGPEVITKHPDLFWGLVVSMWLGNLLLVILNLPLVGVWVRLLRTPYVWLFPAIIVFSCIGAFSVNNSPFAVGITAVFGVIGYVFRKLEFPLAPLALGLVLGPMLEENLRRSLILSRGDPTVFISSPISAFFIFGSLLMIVLMVMPAFKNKLTASKSASELN